MRSKYWFRDWFRNSFWFPRFSCEDHAERFFLPIFGVLFFGVIGGIVYGLIKTIEFFGAQDFLEKCLLGVLLLGVAALGIAAIFAVYRWIFHGVMLARCQWKRWRRKRELRT